MNHRAKADFWLSVLMVFLLFFFLRFPERCLSGFESGLQLCVRTVLPALFPCFVFCELLMAISGHGHIVRLLARLLGLEHPCGAKAVLLSWIGGYAVCARLVCSLRQREQITSREAALVLLLGCCSSPGFVIGCVGGLLLGNLRLGILLYALQLSANLLSTALCLPLLPQYTLLSAHRQQPCKAGPSLPQAISTAVESSLQVCGCLLFYRMAGAVLTPLLPQFVLTPPLVSAFLEISAGCADFAALGGPYALYGCCLCLSLLGLSVWTQLALLLQRTVPLRLLVINRGLHLVIFVLLTRWTVRFLPGVETVYRSLSQRVIPMQRLPADAAVITFIFLCAALYKVRQNFYNK